MAWGLNPTLRNSMLSVISAAIDAGAGPGRLNIYTATRPATGAAITTQTLLGTVTFGDPSFGTPAGGVMSANPIASDFTADASGTAAWFRITDSNGTFVADGNVGTVGSGADLELSNTSIAAGGVISVTSGSLTAPNA